MVEARLAWLRSSVRSGRAAALVCALTGASVARAEPYVPTIGMEHEVKTNVFSIVTDDDRLDTERQVRGASDHSEINYQIFACYKDSFCISVDDGIRLEIMTRPWKRTEFGPRSVEMNKGLADLAVVMPMVAQGTCVATDESWPAWTKETNDWGGKQADFKAQQGCRKSLWTLVDELVALKTGWRSTSRQDELGHVYLFRAAANPKFVGTLVSSTQINLTVPVKAFAQVDTLKSLFSEFAKPRMFDHARFQLASDLFKEPIDDPTGFLRLLNYSMGMTALMETGGVTGNEWIQGGVKNAYDLYPKSYLANVYEQLLSTLKTGPARDEFAAKVAAFKLRCGDVCSRTVRDWVGRHHHRWTPWDDSDNDGRPTRKQLMKQWNKSFALNLERIVDGEGEAFPLISRPWGPMTYDGGLVVMLMEMRHNSYLLNQIYALSVTSTGALKTPENLDTSDLPNPTFR